MGGGGGLVISSIFLLTVRWASNWGKEGVAEGVKSEGVYKPQFMVVGIGLGRWLCL